MNDEAPPTTSIGISDRQQNVMIGLKICSAALSLIGSALIVAKITRDEPRIGNMKPYDRIILGLSVMDMISSIHFATNGFLSSAGPAGCQISAFFNQLTFWAIWYNCILSFYFVLTVLSQVRRKNFVQRSELWLHLTGLYFPVTAIIGASLGLFGHEPFDGVCWLVDPTLKWIFAGIPTAFTFLAVIINNIVIYCLVQKSLRQIEQIAGPTQRQACVGIEARTLMFLYVGFFLLTVTPAFIIQILESYFGYTLENAGKFFPLMIANSILYPLQGFFNVFIYIRPFYSRFRTAHPNKSKWFVLKQAFLKSKAPSLQHRRVANNITHRSDVLITDVTMLSNREMNPNEALFYPGGLLSTTEFDNTELDNPSDQPEAKDNQSCSDEAKEDESDNGSKTEKRRKKMSWRRTDHWGVRSITTKTEDVEEQIGAADTNENDKDGANSQ